MREDRENTGRVRLMKKKFLLYTVIAALCGVGLGILIGIVMAGHRNVAVETAQVEGTGVQETGATDGTSDAEKTETTEPEEPDDAAKPDVGAAEERETSDQKQAEAEEPKERYQIPGMDAYEAFLQEAAENKAVSAGNVDYLVVSGDMYAGLFNQSYPLHPYDTDAFVWDENGRMTYANYKQYRVRHGIDVSEFNEEIDWEKVKEDGIEFAFIRLGFRGYGEGDMYQDAYFAANLAGAQEAGLDIGVYFFAQAVSEQEAEEEAHYVLDVLGGTELQLPIVYDVEPIHTDDARTDDVTGVQFTKNTAAFCRVIEENGYEAGYYANLKWEVFMLDMRELTEYTMWYAGYADRPQTAYDFSIWQYTDQGSVDGVPTNVDMDIQLIPVTPEEAAAIEAAEKKAAEEAAKAAEEAEKKAAEEAAKKETEDAGTPTAEEGDPENGETSEERPGD